MATTELTHSPASHVGERIQHVIEVSAARVAAVWLAAKNRRAVNRLLEWDDRMLRDIGLTQNDVRSALVGGAGDDPSARLQIFSSERRAWLRASRQEASVVRVARSR